MERTFLDTLYEISAQSSDARYRQITFKYGSRDVQHDVSRNLLSQLCHFPNEGRRGRQPQKMMKHFANFMD